MRILQRTIVLVLLVALGGVLFYVGREHRVFLDNKTIEVDGKTFKALEQVNVTIGRGEPIELLARDRDVVETVGPSFEVKVEILDSLGGDVERTLELTLTPGFGKDLLISLPLLAAGRDDFVLPSPALQPSAPSEPSGTEKEAMSPTGVESDMPVPEALPEGPQPPGMP